MKQYEHLRNPILLREMLAKLPADRKMDWEQFKEEKLRGHGNLITFKDWMMNIAKYASKAKVSFQTSSYDNSQTTTKKNDRPRKDFAHHAHEKDDYTPTPSTSEQSLKCEMCEANGHLIDECKKFLELSKTKRWEFILDKRLCRRCLKPHAEKRCKSTKRCGVDGCKTRHSHLLHNYNSQQSPPAGPDEASKVVQNHTVATTCDNKSSQRRKVLFHVIPVTLYGPKGLINTYAFLDSGSEITLLSQDTANEIGLDGDEEQLCLLRRQKETIRNF